MTQRELDYFERRAAEARRRAEASSGIVKVTHERFVAAYAERLAQGRSEMVTGEARA